MSGRLQGAGSLIRFAKNDGDIRWWAKFKLLSNIYAYAYGTDDNLFVCGDYQPSEKEEVAENGGITDSAPYEDVEFKAGIARMNNRGELKWFNLMSGTNP